MRLAAAGAHPEVRLTADDHRPIVLAILPGLAYRMGAAEAHQLADQLHDTAERSRTRDLEQVVYQIVKETP